VKIGIGANRRIIVGKKRGADRSGIGIKIPRTAHSLSIVGSKTLNCPLLGIALSAIVMIGRIDLIGSISMMIGDLTSQLGGECQFMIGCGTDSVCMTDLVNVSDLFPGTKRNLKRWPMHGFPMNSCFAGMLILTEWSQGKIVIHR